MAVWLVLCPALMAGLTFLVGSNRWRPWLLPVAGVLYSVLVWRAIGINEAPNFKSWLVIDPLGKVFLAHIAVLFVLCALYAPSYLALRPGRDNRVLCTCLLLSLSMMTLVLVSHHLGLMWVAMEATTLITAPGIYFNHNARSLEATWKYLLLCSVGIALALLGSFFLAYSSLYAGLEPSLLFDDLVRDARQLSPPWLHIAFVLLFVGYGTKMGLAPMHTWKPDAYGEAPGLVGALLAGGLTNCAFLAILRFYQIERSANDSAFAQRIMVFMGLFSMGLAAISLARQRDIKRLLAYSSVEHMGMLSFGIGIGGSAATLATLWHVIHNGLTKGVLFLSAGNIHRAYGSKFTEDLKGVVHRLPFSGGMFLAGFLAITGSPPFAPFVSEFQIVSAAFGNERYWTGGLFVLLMFIVFVGMGVTVVSVTLGKPSEPDSKIHYRDSWGTGLPILLFMALVVLLGLYNPEHLTKMITEATAFLDSRAWTGP